MPTVAELTAEEELTHLNDVAEARDWTFEQVGSTDFILGMPARDGSSFWLRCSCEGYPGMPPKWHWFNPETKAVDQASDTPTGSGFFHSTGVICAPWNRLAYKAEDGRGPHDDWTIGNWRVNTKTGACRTLTAMALRIAVELKAPTFGGRKG